MFCKETNFKETQIGKIPKDWDIVRLKDMILEAKSGFACGKRDENGILQLRMDSIETGGWINIEAGVKVPIPEGVEDYILRPGDILFNNTNSVDLIGKTAIFKGEFPRCVYSNHLTRLRVNPEKVVPEWILYLLIRKWQFGVFRAICHRHVHQAGINNEDILNLKIPLPPLTEQQIIAEIISTVDEAIQKTNEIIAKTERLKKGLMQELLTKGIGHKEFKDTEIGRIPKEWKVVRLKDIAEKSKHSFVDGPFGSDLKKEEFTEYGIPVIQLHNIRDGFFISDDLKYISREKFVKLKRHETQPGDVVITKLGDPVAQAAVVPAIFEEYMIVADCVRLRVNKEVASSNFVLYAINSIMRASAIARAKGTTRKRINLTEIKELSIPLPSLREQQKIVEILSTIDKKLELERNEKARLERIKQGLMDLLLTGKIRVKVN